MDASTGLRRRAGIELLLRVVNGFDIVRIPTTLIDATYVVEQLGLTGERVIEKYHFNRA